MSENCIIFTIFYILFLLCVISPPEELVSAGFTIQNIFANLLGSEQMFFTDYHIKRTSLTLYIHSLLPLSYFLSALIMENVFQLSEVFFQTTIFIWLMLFSLFLPLVTASIILYWSKNNWSNHPISKSLSYLSASENCGWRMVASSINVEFRRIDKLTSGPRTRRLIVTDTWLMMTWTYSVSITRQSDVHLTIIKAEDHTLLPDVMGGMQILNLTVSNIDKNIKPFKIRVAANDYRDLTDKFRNPILNARNIVIQQTLSDRFLEAFRYQVNQNPVYRKPSNLELESCIGCMQEMSNVKLQKQCDEIAPEGGAPCLSCFCRPMWCLECMGKWFASRQDQQQPETWMSSKSPCPTCRSVFCMLDISCVV